MNNEVLIDPIKGLLPYSTSDSEFYFTDKTQAEAFFRQLNRSKFVVLYGNTGAGKTSFVNCIFDKKFREISNIDEQWSIVHIRPGLNPIKSIPFFLSNSNVFEDKLANGFVKETTNLLMSDSNGLFELFDQYKIKRQTKLLLVIDPLDDLFLLSKVIKTEGGLSAEQYIDAFVNLLCTFENNGRELPVYIVISFSNNFPENVGRYPKFLDLIERNKFLFKGVDLEKVHILMDQIIPENIRKLKDYPSFKEKVKHDLKNEFSNTIEWLFFLQHALKRTIDRWNDLNASQDKEKEGLIKCYSDIGGVRDSVIKHAESLYEKSVSNTEKKFKDIYELIFRAMLDYRGQFVAMPYGNIVGMSVRLDPQQKDYLEEKYINPFIQKMAEMELGFFEIIRSVEESDRAASLTDKEYLSNSDVISIRNKCLIPKWHRLETFQNAKVKLIHEYEWYSRLAYEHKEKGKDNFPTTLQAYALSNHNRDKSKDPEEFKVIDEIFCVNEAWEKSYNDKATRRGFANLEDTKKYIREAINYWIEKASAEEKERIKKERVKSRRVMVISGLVVAFFIISFPVYRHMLKQFDTMKAEFDCLVTENSRIVSFVDSMQIAKLREHAQRNMVSSSIVDTLKAHTSILVNKLRSNGNDIAQKSNALYAMTEWDFMLNQGEWNVRRDSLIEICAGIHSEVLKSAIADNCITIVDSNATDKEIWQKYNQKPEEFKEYAELRYVKYFDLDMKECVLKKDSTTLIPPNYAYFLKCNKCK